MNKKEKVDPSAIINDLFKYVDQYRNASQCLESTTNTLFPSQQVRGLLIELALKTYLCTCGHVAWGHDLMNLADKAVDKGLELKEEDQKNTIPNTNDIYCRGGAWDSDYLCRYPKPNRGTLAILTPSHQMVDDMVVRIISQAEEKLLHIKK